MPGLNDFQFLLLFLLLSSSLAHINSGYEGMFHSCVGNMTDVVDDYEGGIMFMSDAGKGGTRSESECYGRMRHWVLMP